MLLILQVKSALSLIRGIFDMLRLIYIGLCKLQLPDPVKINVMLRITATAMRINEFLSMETTPFSYLTCSSVS